VPQPLPAPTPSTTGSTSHRSQSEGSFATDTDAQIGRAVVRLESAIACRPGFGRRTDVSRTTLGAGLRCTTVTGAHRVEADLPAGLGGDATAPTPGALARAALGSCLAMGYRLRAARCGVQLSSVEVTVETDSDIAGLIDPGSDVAAGFVEVRYDVRIVSDASQAQIEALVELGDRLSPMLDLFGRATPVRRRSTTVERNRPDPDAHGGHE
jgi:uncharacterized OsmC-like protein